MHPKFKHWLTEQKYARYRYFGHSSDSWMIHSVQAKIHKTWILKYSWGEIKNSNDASEI
jgi:hypothetical protein